MNQKRKKKARNRGGLSLSMEGPDSVSTTSMVDTLADTCGHSGHRAAAMMYMMEAARNDSPPAVDVCPGCGVVPAFVPTVIDGDAGLLEYAPNGDLHLHGLMV